MKYNPEKPTVWVPILRNVSVFLFGLMFGLITSALMDLIGFILRPSGAYLPLMAVIVASGGFIRGGLWLL